jgi:hypothetical protein
LIEIKRCNLYRTFSGGAWAFGIPSGVVVSLKMPQRPPLSQRSSAELRAQAAEYRRMADSARTFAAAAALLKIADRYDALADRREIEERAAQADPEEGIPPN